MVTTIGPRQRRLFVGTDRANHRRPERPGPLAHQQPHPTGSRMNQHRIAWLYPVGTAQQILRGHALQHHGGALLETDRFGQAHQPVGRHVADFGIGPERPAGIRDAIAGGQIGHPVPHGFDHPRCLQPDAGGQRDRIQSGAVVGIDEVQAHRMMTHPHLTWGGLGQHHRFPLQNLRTSGLMKADCVRHGVLLRLSIGCR